MNRFTILFYFNAVPTFEVRVDPSSVEGLTSESNTFLCTAAVNDSVMILKTFQWSQSVAGGPSTDLSDNGDTVRITDSDLNAPTSTSQLVIVEHSPGEYQLICNATLQFPGEMDDIHVAEYASMTITGNALVMYCIVLQPYMHMSPENTHKLNMEVLILGVIF